MYKLFEFLRQPYQYYYKGVTLFIVAVIVFVMAVFFNYFFEPFDVYTPEHKMNYFWISLIHSLTPLLIFFCWAGLAMLWPKIDESWTVKKEIIFIVVFLLLVGIGQFLVRDIIYDNPNNWSWRYLFEEIRNTFLVGILFTFILVPLNYMRLVNENSKGALNLRTQTKADTELLNPSKVFVQTQVKADEFSLDIEQFIYAQSERNYVELFLDQSKGIEKILKRITIKELQSHLENFPYVARTHRSYLVNLYKVQKVSGNAQGYRLVLKGVKEEVPVSRNMIPSFERKMKLL